MRDIANHLNLQPAFAPKAAVTDNTAQVSSVCTPGGFGSVMLALITGTDADADATFTLLIEDSPDNSTFTAVDDAYLTGTEVLGSYTFADDGVCRKIGYVGTQPYLRATVTPANNTGNMFLGGVWILGNPSRQPTANPPA
jgi:hypothetical protein